jgi:exodeoxyribonuclease VII large subunit
LNDYELAALLCKRTVPIWVGIGHEKDRTILDEIAHRSFDTPSKVIAGIRNHIVERVQEAVDSLQTIKLLSQHQITTYQSKNDQLLHHIKSSAQSQLNSAHHLLEQMKERIQFSSQQQVKFSLAQIESLMKEVLLQNPKQVQAKGYAIVRSEGKAIRSIHQISSPAIAIEMQDGVIEANITQVIPNEE